MYSQSEAMLLLACVTAGVITWLGLSVTAYSLSHLKLVIWFTSTFLYCDGTMTLLHPGVSPVVSVLIMSTSSAPPPLLEAPKAMMDLSSVCNMLDMICRLGLG